MQLRTFFMALTLLLIAIGIYSFTRNRPSADADNRLQAGVAEPYYGETPVRDSRQRLAEGQFHNVAHTGAGTAAIYKTEDGKLFLEFSEFETAPANDLQVCLLTEADPESAAAAAKTGAFMVAPLKAIMGNQTYELPANLEVAKYRAVNIISSGSKVNFAMARLAEAQK